MVLCTSLKPLQLIIPTPTDHDRIPSVLDRYSSISDTEGRKRIIKYTYTMFEIETIRRNDVTREMIMSLLQKYGLENILKSEYGKNQRHTVKQQKQRIYAMPSMNAVIDYLVRYPEMCLPFLWDPNTKESWRLLADEICFLRHKLYNKDCHNRGKKPTLFEEDRSAMYERANKVESIKMEYWNRPNERPDDIYDDLDDLEFPEGLTL